MSETEIPITWRGRAIAVFIGLIALVALSEITLRIAMPGWRDYHSGRFMTLIEVPGHGVTSIGVSGFDGAFAQNNGDFRVRIRINEFGLRNDEPVDAAHDRIWILGDSMSFGWGVERDETYAQILADLLRVPTYNVATPGSNVCGWQALYARMPKGIRPAAVVVGLTIENRVGIFDCAELANNTLAKDPDTISLTAIKSFLSRHTALYNFMTVSLKRIDLAEMILTRIGLIEDPKRIIFHGQDPSRANDMIAATAAELDRMRSMISTEIPFVVALFPARYELRDGTGHFRRLRIGMAAALTRRGIDTLDLFSDFNGAGLATTHFAHDGHWNARGHRIAGEAIARWFSARPGLLPNRPPESPRS